MKRVKGWQKGRVPISAHPDQTIFRSGLISVYTVCYGLFARILKIITVGRTNLLFLKTMMFFHSQCKHLL